MPSVLKKHLSRLPQRWIMAAMGFFAFFNAYTLRVCLSMAITQMVKPLNNSGSLEKGGNSENEVCPEYSVRQNVSENVEPTAPVGTFEWSEYTQGIILSSFYWGYALTHVPGGLLATRFGPKLTIGLGVLLTAILTILTPAATNWGGSSALIAVRLLMGLCEGVIQPGMSCMLAQWIPARERTTISSWAYIGVRFGILVSTLCSGLLMHRGGGDSWPFVFHLFGGLGVLWYLLWLVLCYDSPRAHPYIGRAELAYLERELADAVTDAPDKPAFPWRRALASPAVLALVLAQSGQDWNSYTVMTDLPKYMNGVLRLPVRLNGYASSLYNVTYWLVCMLASWLSDRLIRRGWATRTRLRKVNALVSSVDPGFLMVAATYVGCDVAAGVALITLGQSLAGTSIPGIKVNSMDLSPNYAGTIMGLSNGVGALMGIFAPYAVGVLAPNQSLHEWRLIFWISAIIALATSVNFCIFASGDVQPWNDPAFLEKDEKKGREEVFVDADPLMLTARKPNDL